MIVGVINLCIYARERERERVWKSLAYFRWKLVSTEVSKGVEVLGRIVAGGSWAPSFVLT